jgi:polyhydroxybutyrate depolymerase
MWRRFSPFWRIVATCVAFLALLSLLLSLAAKSDGNTQGSLTVDGRERTYELHVPVTYKTDQPVPLALILHGRLGDGRGTAALTHFDKVSDAHGFLAIYPDGLHRSWADGRKVTDSDKEGTDDVKFLSELIHKLSSAHRIDGSRIYVAGISNGGFMTQRVACELSDQIAAVGVVAATMSEQIAASCHPNKPVSVVMMQGSLDTFVPIQGGAMGPNGSRGQILSLRATAEKWAGFDGCNSAPERSTLPDIARDGTTVQRESFSGCKEQAEVVAYTVEGGGHTWPGGKQYLPAAIIGKTTRNMDASEILWEFFARHSR